ncbi:hypothetical protein SteCoe_28868 [Stentor coeruleus]|uniref:Uncharacterized protein n=1 Tax=Stentor coeruleus TaxID=5963 RepID=A0A1R2B763_9CILI|nr:hypothetical protein SteCoe_28868 [Stentor coeruleus]
MDSKANPSQILPLSPDKPKETFSTTSLSPRKAYHRKTSSFPFSSLNKNSISIEVKANSPTSNTIHFNALHSRYNTATLNISSNLQELSESTEKKYINNITRLNEEILIMSTQLKQANETIASLTQELNNTNSKHAQYLQTLHERQEQKIRRNQQDMDRLIREMNSKSLSMPLEKIILEKNLEIEVQKRKFNGKIDEMTKWFEKNLEAKDLQQKNQLQNLKDQFLDIILSFKEGFFEEIDNVLKRSEIENRRVKEDLNRIDMNEAEDDSMEVTRKSPFIIGKYEKKVRNDDLQIIEELSSEPGMIIRKTVRESAGSELDLSLRFLINQINVEYDQSISDYMHN